MNVNLLPDSLTPKDTSLNIPSLDNLTIHEKTQPNEVSNNHDERRPSIPILKKQDLNDQRSMTIYQKSKNNNFRQSMESNNRMGMHKRERKPRKVDLITLQILNEPQTIPEGWKTVEFTIDFNNVIYVEGSKSIYSPVYNNAPFKLFEQNFNSVDDAYQINKLNDLCGSTFAQQFCEKKTTGEKRAFVRESTKFIGVTKEEIINWRSETGLDVIFNATVEKFVQNSELLNEMKKDKEKLIINTFGNDPIDGCGDKEAVDVWIAGNTGKTCVIPAENNPSNLLNFPTVGAGKNVQGVMVMLARHAISINNDW